MFPIYDSAVDVKQAFPATSAVSETPGYLSAASCEQDDQVSDFVFTLNDPSLFDFADTVVRDGGWLCLEVSIIQPGVNNSAPKTVPAVT